MIEITPLSNTEDILREANENAPVAYVPVVTDSFATPVAIAKNEAATIDVNHVPVEMAYATPVYAQSSAPVYVPVPPVLRADTADDIQQIYTYRLPVFSYVLVWFYGLLAVVLAFMLVASINSYSAMSGYQSSYGGAAYAASALKGYQLALVFYAIGLLLVLGIGYALLSGKKVLRYVALVISILALGYELYTVGPLLGSSTGALAGAFMSLYVVMYAPYVFLPLVTTVYLLTPKAASAYR